MGKIIDADCNNFGFIEDKNRIPEIDISLKDKQVWKYKKFEAKIFHIPGHPSGHICFKFFICQLVNLSPNLQHIILITKIYLFQPLFFYQN